MTTEKDYNDLINELKDQHNRLTLKHDLLKMKSDSQDKIKGEMFSGIWENSYEG